MWSNEDVCGTFSFLSRQCGIGCAVRERESTFHNVLAAAAGSVLSVTVVGGAETNNVVPGGFANQYPAYTNKNQ